MKNMLLILALSLLSGCVMTYGTFQPATEKLQAKATIYRFAVLYPFEISDLSVDKSGVFHLGNYKTDGGTEAISAISEGVAKGVIKGVK